MNITTAIQIINDRCEIYGMSLLDTVIVMREMLDNDELDNSQAVAYRVFMREGQRMMAPA
jgi:hypothetical protein